jgi:hypothetical protein
MPLRLVDEPACPDCDGVAEIIEGVTHLSRPVAVLGHRGTCPTLRAVQCDEASPLWRTAGR